MKSDLPGRMELAGLDLNSDEGLGQALASLPVRSAPPGLTTSLRVIASQQRQRFTGRGMFGEMFARWHDRASLGMKNVMRPLALPLAGGLFSAVALFSMLLLPTYPRSTSALDSPTMLNVGTVLVTVDDHGRMVDYTVMSGAGTLQEPVLRHQLENFLDYTTFVPATSLGRPRSTWGRVRIPVFTSSIVVKD
jgi:hypothetical protein